MVTHRTDTSATVRALKGAAPYVRLYKGKVFVVKAGGAVFADNASTRVLIEQIAILHHLGIRVVLVHGEYEAQQALAERLKDEYGWEPEIPKLGDTISL